MCPTEGASPPGRLGTKGGGCEYRLPVKSSGFEECWGTLAKPDPHVLDLYHKDVVAAVWSTNPAIRAEFSEYAVGGRDGELRSPYDSLPPVVLDSREVVVAEGTGAIIAYEEMLFRSGRQSIEAKEKWASLLRQYCKLDTAAMVMIWCHWSRSASG